MKKVLIPLPNKDFDLTEVAIPWKYFRDNNIEVVFSTEDGQAGQTDPLLISGVIFGQLGAEKDALQAYREMEEDRAFQNPITYAEINPEEFDMIHLPGGHAKGMRQYLESETLRAAVLTFYQSDKLIAGICHGPIVLARTIDPATGKSIIHGKKISALSKLLEKTAYYLTAWKLGDYYRTYPEYVQDEMSTALGAQNNFCTGKNSWTPFVQEDGNFITARWPKDAHVFAQRLVDRLKG